MKKLSTFGALLMCVMLAGCAQKKEAMQKSEAGKSDCYGDIISASYSPDGRKVLVAFKEIVVSLDSASGKVLKVYRPKNKIIAYRKSNDEEFVRSLVEDLE